jgi:hypothetical protein
MFRFRTQSKTEKQNAQQRIPEKETAPASSTTDPYVVGIVRMLEQLRNEKKN